MPAKNFPSVQGLLLLFNKERSINSTLASDSIIATHCWERQFEFLDACYSSEPTAYQDWPGSKKREEGVIKSNREHEHHILSTLAHLLSKALDVLRNAEGSGNKGKMVAAQSRFGGEATTLGKVIHLVQWQGGGNAEHTTCKHRLICQELASPFGGVRDESN